MPGTSLRRRSDATTSSRNDSLQRSRIAAPIVLFIRRAARKGQEASRRKITCILQMKDTDSQLHHGVSVESQVGIRQKVAMAALNQG